MPTIRKSERSNAAELLRRLTKEFPQLSWQIYEYIDIGWDHEVIILDNRIVFRFPNDEDYLDSLKTEIEILNQLKPLLRINIPVYEYVSQDKSFAGYPIVPGKFLSKELMDSFKQPERSEIAKQLAETLTTLHTLSLEGGHFVKLPNSYLNKDQDEVKQLTSKFLSNVLRKGEIILVNKFLRDIDDLLEQQNPIVFLHGDVYSQHLLWDAPLNKLGLIDFSDMMRADPAIDFAELFEYGNSFVDEVYVNYNGPKDDTFLERAWKYQCWVSVYMMTDHFVYHKTSFEIARETFDRVKLGQ